MSGSQRYEREEGVCAERRRVVEHMMVEPCCALVPCPQVGDGATWTRRGQGIQRVCAVDRGMHGSLNLSLREGM